MLLVPVHAFDAVQEVVLLEFQVRVVEPLYTSVVLPALKVSVGGIGVGVGAFVGVGVGIFVGVGVGTLVGVGVGAFVGVGVGGGAAQTKVNEA